MRIDVMAVLKNLGIEPEVRGRQAVAPCPNPDHDDGSPSWAIVVDREDAKYGVHGCWSCGLRGNIITLAAGIWDTDPKTAREKIMGGDFPRLPTNVVVPRTDRGGHSFALPRGVVIPESVDEWPPVFGTYLRLRGLQLDVATRHGVGYADTGKLRGRIVWPLREHGVPITYSARLVDYRPWLLAAARARGITPPSQQPGVLWFRDIAARLKGGVAAAARTWLQHTTKFSALRYITGSDKEHARTGDAIYMWDSVFPMDEVTVFEGCLKADLAVQAGWWNAVAILGKEWTPARIAKLSTIPRVFVATDPDDAGDESWERIRAALPRHDLIRARAPRAFDDMTPQARKAFMDTIATCPVRP